MNGQQAGSAQQILGLTRNITEANVAQIVFSGFSLLFRMLTGGDRSVRFPPTTVGVSVGV